MQAGLRGDWIAAQQARALQAPLRPRTPLHANGQPLGSVVHEVMQTLLLGNGQLPLSQHFKWVQLQTQQTPIWQIEGDITLALNALADHMHDLNVGQVRHYWRNEKLAVTDVKGARVGSVERGAVRPLGIATRAVHLVGITPDAGMWVQQRSFTKANDPGMWDTLMGGMVSAQDTLQTALERETFEEAGLLLNQLRNLRYGGCVTLRRPTGEADDDGIGYVVETIDWYQCTLPHGVIPVNQDGEVAQFELLAKGELVHRLHDNQFTLEAALVMVAALTC